MRLWPSDLSIFLKCNKLNLRDLTIILICIALTGCQNGCTTSKTIDSESKTINIKGTDCEITARLIEYRNSKAKNRNNLFNRKITYFYGVVFDVELPNWKGRELAEIGVKSEDIDIEPFLNRFSINFSDGNYKHLAIGIDDKTSVVFHNYKGHIFQSSFGHTKSVNVSTFDFNLFPDPGAIILQGLSQEHGCKMVINDEATAYLAFLNDLPEEHPNWQHILKNWPECSLINNYLSDTLINRRKKEPLFKDFLGNRALEVLEKNDFGSRNEEATRIILSLDDKTFKEKLDMIQALKYGDNGSKANQYIIENWGRLSVDAKQTLALRTNEVLKKFMRSGDDNMDYSMDHAVQILLKEKEISKIDNLINRCLEINFWNDNYFDVSNIVFGNFKSFSPTQQDLILKKTLENLPQSKSYLQENIFEDSSEFFDCKTIRKIYDDCNLKESPYVDWPEKCPNNPKKSTRKTSSHVEVNTQKSITANF